MVGNGTGLSPSRRTPRLGTACRLILGFGALLRFCVRALTFSHSARNLPPSNLRKWRNVHSVLVFPGVGRTPGWTFFKLLSLVSLPRRVPVVTELMDGAKASDSSTHGRTHVPRARPELAILEAWMHAVDAENGSRPRNLVEPNPLGFGDRYLRIELIQTRTVFIPWVA